MKRIPALAPLPDADWPENLPRPARLLDPPEPVTATALLPDHPPAFFVWRTRAPPRGQGRRAGAHHRRMVEIRARAFLLCATITASRASRAHASGSSAMRRPPRAGAGGCMGSSHDLCRASGHDAFLVPARRLEPARDVRAGEAPRPPGARRSSTATRSPASCAPTRRRRRPACASSSAAGSISPTARRFSSIPTDRAAYSRLCRLLSLGKSRAGKGKCSLAWDDVEAWNEGLLAVLLGDHADEALQLDLRRLKRIFGDRGLHGPDPPLRSQRASAPVAGRAGRSGRTRADRRHGRHPLSSSLRAACCRTSSPASARAAPSTRPASVSSGMRTAFSRIRPRWRACSSGIRKRWPGPTRSSGAAASRSMSCAISIRARREPGETAQEKLERLTWEGAERRYRQGSAGADRRAAAGTSLT